MTSADLLGIRAQIRADLVRLGISQSELARRLRARGRTTPPGNISRTLAASPSPAEQLLADILDVIAAPQTRRSRSSAAR